MSKELYELESDFFQVGGTLAPQSPSYVERACDRELFQASLKSELCQVLSTRQTGKSSLMVRTAAGLREHGIAAVTFDFNGISKPESLEQLCFEICWTIAEDLRRRTEGLAPEDFDSWWEERRRSTPGSRMMAFFQQIADRLEHLDRRLVVFFDEIESTISYPFNTDDFFFVLRSCHNGRATQPSLRRLGFVLIGVASPTDLIKDRESTPFNVGKRIKLTDFTEQEVARLLPGLETLGDRGEQVLHHAHDWTSGQPYLTQKLLAALARHDLQEPIELAVESTVTRLFLREPMREEEHNLNSVLRRVRAEPPAKKRRLLKHYRRILDQGSIPADPQSYILTRLELTGLVKETDRKLVPRNRLYAKVFDRRWIQEEQPPDLLKKSRRLTAFIVGFALVLLLGLLILAEIYQIGIRRQTEKIRSAEPTASLHVDEPVALHQALRRLPGFKRRADVALARFWKEAARHSERSGNMESALIYRLKALAYREDRLDKKRAAYAAQPFSLLNATYRDPRSRPILAVAPDLEHWVVGAMGPDTPGTLFRGAKEQAELGEITAAAFSQDGRRLVVGTRQGGLKIFQQDSDGVYEGVTSVDDSQSSIRALDVQSRLLASGDSSSVKLWRLETDGMFKLFTLNPSADLRGAEVSGVALSPDGRWLAIIWRPMDEPFGKLHLFYLADVASSDESRRARPLAESGIRGFTFPKDLPVNSVTFLQGGWLLAGGYSVSAWKLENGRNPEPQGPAYEGHSAAIIAFGEGDSEWFATSGGEDRSVRMWRVPPEDLRSPLVLRGFSGAVTSLSVSSATSRVVTGTENGTLRTWQSSKTLEVPDRAPVGEGDSPILYMSLSPDLEALALADDAGRVFYWPSEQPPEPLELRSPGTIVVRLAHDPTGRLLFAGLEANANVYRLTSQELGLPPEFLNHGGATVVDGVFSADGRRLFTATNQGKIYIWKTDDLRAAPEILSPKTDRLTDRLLLSEAAGCLISLESGALRLYGLREGDPQEMIELEIDPIRLAVAVDPQRPYLAVSDKNTIRVWRLRDDSGALVREPVLKETPEGFVSALAFQPGGGLLAGDLDGRLRSFQVSDEESRRLDPSRWPSDREAIRALLFSREGSTLVIVTAHRVRTVRVEGADREQQYLTFPYPLWNGIYRLREQENYDKISLVFVGLDATRSSFFRRELPLDLETILARDENLDIGVLSGEPETILREWQERLSLRLVEDSTTIKP